MGTILFLFSVACGVLFGLFVNAIFRHISRTRFLIGWFILTFAEVVLTAEICSLIHSLNINGFLIVQIILTGVGWGLWRLSKSPGLFGPFDWRIRLPAFRDNKFLYIFGIICLAAYLVNALVILRVPQNNYDSMTYHLARVGYWMQNETLFPWETSNPRQTSFPPNAEIGMLWSMLFLRSDVLTGFVQWSFAGAGFLAIFGASTMLRATRKQALFAGLAWLTLPQVVLQSTTTQNDVILSSLFLIAVFFLYSGWSTSRREELILSGVALGLAAGTKVTAGMAVPGLGIFCLILWIKSRQPQKFFFTLAASYILGFILFGSLGYIQNLVYYGTLLGPKEYSDAALGVFQPGLRIKLQTVLVYVYQFLDFAGLPPEMAKGLIEIKAKLAGPIFNALGLHINYASASVNQILHYAPRLHEDFSWFGPLSMLALFPGIVISAWQSVRRKNGLLIWGMILVAMLFTGVLILQGWSPHKSRYMVLTVTLLAPALACLYSNRKPAYSVILAIIGCFVLWHTILRNEAKPLAGPGAIWGEDAIALRTINNPMIEPLARAVEETLPPGARLGVKLGSNGWDYIFFGDQMDRILTQLGKDPSSRPAEEFASADDRITLILENLVYLQVEYVAVGPQQEFFLRVPAGLETLVDLESGGLYKVVPGDIGKSTDLVNGVLPSLDITGILQIDTPLSQNVGVMEVWTGSWAIEQNQGDSFLWLGQGEAQGLGAKLWAEQDQIVCIDLSLVPGPSREDALRTISYVYFDEDEQRVTRTASFDRPDTLTFMTPLHPGVNSFGFSILEPATILVLPNGDNRQLLARLEQITVTENTGACP
jgi:hypothetical protein